MTSDIEELVGYSNDTRSSSQNDHKDQQSQHVQQRWGRISDFFLKEETDVVGLKEQIKEVIYLTSMANYDRFSQVIAVVGEGGSGKTTLVTGLYSTLLATRNFNRCAFVNVPSLFRVRYVLADIIKQIKGDNLPVDPTVSEEELMVDLNKMLSEGTYLIVIEDVESKDVWKALCRGFIFSTRKFGSRIILTTGNEDVARHVSSDAAGSILKVCQLTDENSWKLFRKKVQIEEDILNESELITFKEHILKVCGGLPLRIALLGGLLSTKEPSCDEWSRVIKRANNYGEDIFALCYQDLPSQVKPCFLYLGLFPRGFEIPVRRLIHLWTSEGFVTVALDPEATETVPEDLAESYFEELVIRSMIEVKWRLDGSPETCRMAGVLYDIFSPKAADMGFFYHQLHSSHDLSDSEPQFAVRRLAKSLDIESKSHTSFSQVDVRNLRSCVAFYNRIPCRPAMEVGALLNKIITGKDFVLLKVLDLEGVYKPVLSDDLIGKLLLLSYLGLRSTAIDSLPSSLGKMPCLETLDVKHTIIHDLPTFIWQAKKLRHLYLNRGCSTNFKSLSNQTLQPPTNLQTLWGLSIDDGGVSFLRKLTGLRRLGLTCTSESSAETTAEWVSQMTKLQSLKLRSIWKESNESFDLELPTMKTHHKLQQLYLIGTLSKIPLTNVEFPPNLRMLTLSKLFLQDDPMPVLGGLPHLHILRLLAYSYWGYEMNCESGGFPKLLVLKLWNLENLTELRVQEGAMPCLRELEVRNSLTRGEATGLQHLTALKKVALRGTALAVSDFVESEERDLHIYKR